jgi:hypothetical protein
MATTTKTSTAKTPATKARTTKAAPAIKEATPAKAAPTTKAAPTSGSLTNMTAAEAKAITEEAAPTKAEKPKATRSAKPGAYIRKDRTRRATGSRVQVLDLRAEDAPADAVKPKGGQHFATHCVTHGTTEHHDTYGAAYKASKVSHEWCGKCHLVDADAVKTTKATTK